MPLLGIVALYVLTCWIVGLMGRKKILGFWGLFLTSIFLTPVIGLLLLLTSKKKQGY
jgi:hypothetical protein